MSDNSAESLRVSDVIHAIPTNLHNRVLREIQHALHVNLCLYETHYLTHTSIHYTSAESQHVNGVIAEVITELEKAGWFACVETAQSNFLEVYVADCKSLVDPVNHAAFFEADGVGEDSEEGTELDWQTDEMAAMQAVSEEPLPNAHVSGMLRLSHSEKVASLLSRRFPNSLTSHVVRTSLHGPYVLVEGKQCESFAIYPRSMNVFGEPEFDVGPVLESSDTSGVVRVVGIQTLMDAVEDKLVPDKSNTYVLLQKLEASEALKEKYAFEYDGIRITAVAIGSAEKAVNVIFNDSDNLFKVIHYEDGNEKGTLLVDACDVETLLCK